MKELTLSQAAMAYIKPNGYRHAMKVFPLRPNKKKPITKNGFHDASFDEETVRNWWKENTNANIGIPTGKENGIVVIDFDTKEEEGFYAEDSIAVLEEKLGTLTDTWQAITPGGGYHYFYKYPEGYDIGRSIGKLYPHVDILGNDGYVVAHPSVRITGRSYEWEAEHTPSDIPLAELPARWLEAILNLKEETSGQEASGNNSAFTLPDIIPEGQRNDTLFRYACSLRARGRKASFILSELQTVNRERCEAPMAEKELTTIFDQAMGYDYKPTKNVAGGSSSNNIDSVRPADFSDIGNATVLERINGSTMRWTASLGWLVWDGKKWARSHDQMARRYARTLTDLMLAEAQQACEETLTFKNAKAEIPDAEKNYLKHAEKSRSARSIDNILSVAQTTLYTNASIFDANPWELNTPEGIVNLQTGEIRPHDLTAYCSKITAVSPERTSGILWADFLNRIAEGNIELIEYLQYFAGMCSIGTVTHEGVLIANGGGSNGKSTFFNALAAVMGDYATSIDVTVLTTDRQNRGASLATLRGARLVTCGELEEGQRMSIQTLKKIASTDPISIEEKYKQPETIIPTHHICLFTNHLPKIGSTDTGTWKRITVVPFNATMPTGSARIPNYAQHLAEEEGAAILQWIVDGAVKFHQNGNRLPICSDVEEATAAYRAREDWVNRFIDECCIVDREAEVRCGELFDAYKKYADQCGDYQRRRADFNAALEMLGFKQITHGKNKMYWSGLAINFEYLAELKADYGTNNSRNWSYEFSSAKA